MKPFRILLADSYPVFRLGLRTLLGAHPGWQVAGEAANGRAAVDECLRLKPELAILDISLPGLNGLDVARRILEERPQQLILVVTAVEAEQVIREALQMGVRGWISKADAAEDLVMAVEAVQRQKTIFSTRVSELVMDGYRRHEESRPVLCAAADAGAKLSSREREVVQLISEGMSSKEIATTLKLALSTAETHRSNILRKLRLHSIAELVLYAVRNGIIEVHVAPPKLSAFSSRLSAQPKTAVIPSVVEGSAFAGLTADS